MAKVEIDEPRKLLTKRMVARSLSISVRSLEREMARGSFPTPVKVGSAVRIPVEDVALYLGWLEERRKGGAR